MLQHDAAAWDSKAGSIDVYDCTPAWGYFLLIKLGDAMHSQDSSCRHDSLGDYALVRL